MFRKILIFAMFFTAAGYCFADSFLHQVVTSEVFTKQEGNTVEKTVVVDDGYYKDVPAWPLVGSDADVQVVCDEDVPGNVQNGRDNIRIVSKIGDDMIVDNTFNFGDRADGWSGGANMLHGTQIPVGFDDECVNKSEMPLLHREILEDDGGAVLTVSRSNRKVCGVYADRYKNYAMKDAETKKYKYMEESEVEVKMDEDIDAPVAKTDGVRSWIVANGQTLREVLQDWCNKEGWDLVWTTSREYPIEASAVFKGRFTDVASALVRNFGRATPIPYAKFYKGNRVLVISTSDE